MSYRISLQMNFLLEHPEAGAVGPESHTWGQAVGSDSLRGFLATTRLYMRTFLVCVTRFVTEPSCVELLSQANRRLPDHQMRGRSDFMLRIGEVSRLANLDRVLYLYRLHSESTTATKWAEVRLGIAFASHNALCRAIGRPEATFQGFATTVQRRTRWRQFVEWSDMYAFGQYRKGMMGCSSGETGQGYTRLAWAALCSPPRTWQRLRRFAAHFGMRMRFVATSTLVAPLKRPETGLSLASRCI